MANRYIHAEIEIRLGQLGITDIPNYVNETLEKDIARMEKKEQKK